MFNDVDHHTEFAHEHHGAPEYETLGNPADMHEDLLVFYSPYKDEEEKPKPVKAWRRYNQVWHNED